MKDIIMITLGGRIIAAGTANPLAPAKVPQNTAVRSDPCCLLNSVTKENN